MAFTVDIRGNASHLQKTINKAESSLKNLGSKVVTASGAGIAAMGAAGAAGLGVFIVKSSEAAASLEDLAMQFEVLTGSAEKSKELLAAFREEEKKSALSTQDYANAAKTILAFGGAYDSILPTLKMIGDVSMGNADRFASLSLAFAQTTAAGRLMGQEVLQFVNAGFNPLAQIAKDTGRSMADLKKEMEAGKISVDMVRQAFVKATSEGGLFFKAIDKGSATTSAKINQAGAAITQLQVAFGTGMNEGLKSALDATSNFLPQLQERFTQAGNTLGIAIKDAVNGNTELLTAIGGLLGEIVMAGFKSVYMKAMDETITGTQSVAQSLLTLNKETFRAIVTGNPARLMGEMRDISMGRNRQQSSSLSDWMATQADQVSQGPSAQKINQIMTQKAIAEGVKTGINESMSTEVRQGIIEAWGWERRNSGAKFSN